jgi:MoaA/NifB/PqqE/SkfB family radical SAM enzyme
MINKKYFPIKTDPSCRLKWSWSTIMLNTGTTSSCHRSSESQLTIDTFDNFHNTPEKIRARELMLGGKWPLAGCEFCKSTEDAGGTSDRQFQNQIPDIYPTILDINPMATTVDPVILEVFFSNACNLRCVYCHAGLSSAIQTEDKKFGGAIIKSLNYDRIDNQYSKLVPKFWDWFGHNSDKLKRLQILGGEPFLQEDFSKLINYFENQYHPELEFNIITNLSLPSDIMRKPLQRLANLVESKKLKRVDILASIDCWGPSQEFVRNKIALEQFNKNIQLLMDLKLFRIGLLTTVTSLSIYSMIDLLRKHNEWSQIQKIFWYMHLVLPHDSSIFSPTIFDYGLFEHHLNEVERLMPNGSWDSETTREIFRGIVANLRSNCQTNIDKQRELFNYLEEIDRRRNSNWRNVFPWLAQEFKKNHVV